MTQTRSEKRSRDYYDEFSATYEERRSRGYHALVDDLEVDLAARYCHGRVLEAGCGTGLILRRLGEHCDHATGIDLSAGMLAAARDRGLGVAQASVDALPFSDETFDTVVSFKVLAHVPAIAAAVAELARVTRPGGHVLLEFYNRHSLRTLIKRLKNPTRIGSSFSDEDVHTRFDNWAAVKSYLPSSLEVVGVRGVRVFTPVALVHDIPLVAHLLAAAERWAADAPLLRWLGGFLIVVATKR
jgi:ubiquinone/menaquinone biosynthesis C-methylase UbiE